MTGFDGDAQQANIARYGLMVPSDAKMAEVKKLQAGRRQKTRGVCLLTVGIFSICGSLWPASEGHRLGVAMLCIPGVILTIAGMVSFGRGEKNTSVSWETRVRSDMVRGKVSCQDCMHCYLRPTSFGWQRKSVAQRQSLHFQGVLPHKKVCAHPEASGWVVSERLGLLTRYGNCFKINKKGKCPFFEPGSPMFYHFADAPPVKGLGLGNKVLHHLWRKTH